MAAGPEPKQSWAVRNPVAITVIGAVVAYATLAPFSLGLFLSLAFSETLGFGAAALLASATQFFLPMIAAYRIARRKQAPLGEALRASSLVLGGLTLFSIFLVLGWLSTIEI